MKDGRAERHSATQSSPHIAFICEFKKQVRIGLDLRGEGQSAISDRATAAHGISNPSATEQRNRTKIWFRAVRTGALPEGHREAAGSFSARVFLRRMQIA